MVLWTDEAHFAFIGNIIFKICIHWTDKNLHDVRHSLYTELNDCVCVMASTYFLGPCLFEQVTSTGTKTCSVARAWYATLLQNYLIQELQQRNINNDIAWMLDGAPPNVTTNFRRVHQQI